jgi:hypothetical protein
VYSPLALGLYTGLVNLPFGFILYGLNRKPAATADTPHS